METNNWLKAFDRPLTIAGPCSAESEAQMLEIARGLPKDKVEVFRAGIWKPRTKPNCFEGVGAIGLNWLSKVRDEFGYKISTEIANANHAKLALEYDVDILWIGARTTVNPFQIQEIAEALRDTDKIVLVKNPINPDLELWIGALERLNGQGIKNLGVIHRGFSTYKKDKYRNQPQWQIPLDLKNRLPEIPIICDPSHIAGNRELIHEISQKAMNFGFEGLMIETHVNPDEAWSDAQQQITPERLDEILKALKIREESDPDKDFHVQLESLRNQIDDTDTRILDMLYERMDISKNIGMLKKEHNVTVFQPKRWQNIQEQILEKASKHGLSEEFVNRFLTAVHQESIKIQNQIMGEN
ncbi:Phospho-2-dehydro-3-deoxyheptonate aldolase [Candidatus Ornithobacterium hominis]|uniref:chorismate mutase n=1 Tax=Candidatus Ornithobacterium hominis TaxID=2497989 RepID=A0A383TWJ3_9FLAO|nr:bifunctional 3-deoxy-7-phosphoheptulonate synthase/chorismate mutase type II [Candidatus Ornithobacterium hominis]MCT7903820.1 bifunctional 3-deoxy-7-phosphoheptulonate synthase/chorismate mutase type II [Candidatus Ornithobacterium hominis]SZD71163.1 Phospho-2-dehydro-3-deoxyheptonate aldolase [Candidatus Ornithobacterium hominis]